MTKAAGKKKIMSFPFFALNFRPFQKKKIQQLQGFQTEHRKIDRALTYVHMVEMKVYISPSRG